MSNRNILVGNGINIQFDPTSYTTQQLVLRVLMNCDRDDFPSHIIVDYPYLFKNYMAELYLAARDVVSGKYDQYTVCTAERNSLRSFKEQYANRIVGLKMTDIGFEDYYLIHDLVCHKNGIVNPEQFTVREAMKIAYLFAIFNDGKLNKLNEKYPEAFRVFLSSFDELYTTNYDCNIEKATGKLVYHIHGAFEQKSDVYTEDSFRNQLPDAPLDRINVDEEYYYLYSNALSTHAGEYKEFQLKQGSQANDCIEKFAAAYVHDEKLQRDVEKWCSSDNSLTRNMGYAIKLKAEHPELRFQDDYHFEKFKSMTGTLDILGLSPWNDFHIFESINNADIVCCIYYYYSKAECDKVSQLLPELVKRDALEFRDARDFWKEMNEKEK